MTKEVLEVLSVHHQMIVYDMVMHFSIQELVILRQSHLGPEMVGTIERYKDRLIAHRKSRGRLIWDEGDKSEAAFMIVELTDFSLELKYQYGSTAAQLMDIWMDG